MIGPWVRRLGLTDKRLSPSHSWRHRFKTMSRRHELMIDIANAITGHHRKTVADSYEGFRSRRCIESCARSQKLKLSEDSPLSQYRNPD